MQVPLLANNTLLIITGKIKLFYAFDIKHSNILLVVFSGVCVCVSFLPCPVFSGRWYLLNIQLSILIIMQNFKYFHISSAIKQDICYTGNTRERFYYAEKISCI